MREINVCIPTLRRHDKLLDLVKSLGKSTSPITGIYVINNGRMDMGEIREAATAPLFVLTPAKPMGVAESWNWFIDNVEEDRVITNDDVVFAPESLAALTASKAELIWAAKEGFSCFVIRDSCVGKLGKFDETISPGYAYYEDDDYLQRLDGRGTRSPLAIAENVECGIKHERSSTLKAAEHTELLDHHRRFGIAQANYMKKWGLTTI